MKARSWQGFNEGAILVRPGKGTMHLGPHFDTRHIAINPDSKYTATANHNGDDGVKIWNTETGRLLLASSIWRGLLGIVQPRWKLAVRRQIKRPLHARGELLETAYI